MKLQTSNAQVFITKSFLPFIFTLLFFLPISVIGQCPGTSCTYTITGPDSGSYQILNGEKICLDPGADFTGSITLRDGELINCATMPQSFNLSFISTSIATVNNYGTLNFTSNLNLRGSSTTINNYDLISVDGTLETISGSNVTLNNQGTLDLTSDMTLDGSATFNNYDLVSVDGVLEVTSGSNFDNFGTTSAIQLVLRNDLNNSGTLNVSTTITNTTNGVLTNTGDITAADWSASGPWTNSGFITISNSCLSGSTSVGTISGGCISCNSFTNQTTITGTTCGNILVEGTSFLNSTGALLGDIALIDATPPASAPFIDINIGTVGPNIVWSSCTSCAPSPPPPSLEVCGNGIDDNGDGRIDEGYPGGVESPLQLWLNASEGTNTISNGSDITSWGDQSPNSYSADADPGATDWPTYSTNTINFHPAITFDGTYTDNLSDGLNLGDDYIYSTNGGMHIFTVVNPNGSSNQFRHPYQFGGTIDSYGFAWSTNNSRVGTPSSHGGTGSFNNHASGPVSSLLEFEIKFNDTQTLYKEGSALNQDAIPTLSQLTANEILASNAYGNATSGPVSIGRKSSNEFLDQDRVFFGDISEVLVFNDTLSQVDKEKVNSYLAIKYGFTMPHNYLFSDGTLLKDITDGYANNIAGIGVDSCGALFQKQSSSVDNSAIVSVANLFFATTNNENTSTFLNDKSALVWGHNGATVNSTWDGTNYDIPNGGYLGIDRVWKFNEINDVQNVVLRVDVDVSSQANIPSLPAFPNSDGSYYLFIDDDGDFTNGGTSVQSMSLVNGSIWEITIADPSTSYFSVGIKIPEICNDGIDNDGDGDIDCLDVDCNTSYNAIGQTNTGLVNGHDALGTIDSVSVFFGVNDEMTIDLGSVLGIGEEYTLNILAADCTLGVEESIDGVNFFPASGAPYVLNSTVDITIATTVHARYIRLSLPSTGNQNLFLDAVSYENCECQASFTFKPEYSLNGAPDIDGSSISILNGDDLRVDINGVFSSGTFIWSGPDGRYQLEDSGPTRDHLTLNNIQHSEAGIYNVFYFDTVGCMDSTFVTVTVFGPEICNNGIDDDGDGDIDCADSDCSDFDSDGDQVCDFIDLDNDNDGIPNLEEGCGVTTDITGTIGINNPVTNTTYSLTGTDITYSESGGNLADITGHDGLLQGPVLRIHTLTTSDGTLSADFSNDVGSINFKIVDFDGFEEVIVNIYDGNNVLYDLDVEGVVSVGTLIEQTSNQFMATTSHNSGGINVDGNDPADDPLGSVIFYLKGPVSRIDFIYVQSEESSIRISEPSFCTGDADGDMVFNSFDLDSDNDGIFDLDEAGHSDSDLNADGIIDGAPSKFGTNGLSDGVETAADNGILNYTIADSESTPDGIYDAYEIDADGDSCFDGLEQRVADGDADGIAGTGIPTVSPEGLVNGIIYFTPPNTDWQNPAVIPCCNAMAPTLSKN